MKYEYVAVYVNDLSIAMNERREGTHIITIRRSQSQEKVEWS